MTSQEFSKVTSGGIQTGSEAYRQKRVRYTRKPLHRTTQTLAGTPNLPRRNYTGFKCQAYSLCSSSGRCVCGLGFFPEFLQSTARMVTDAQDVRLLLKSHLLNRSVEHYFFRVSCLRSVPGLGGRGAEGKTSCGGRC